MSILSANLKHLYQRRGAWFWHAFMLCYIPLAVMTIREGNKTFIAYFINFYFWGDVGRIYAEGDIE